MTDAAPPLIPSHWQKVAAISMDRVKFACVWGARDRETDVVTIFHEYIVPLAELPVHAYAVRSQAAWIPVVINSREFGRKEGEARNLLQRLASLDINLFDLPYEEEAGIADMHDRLLRGTLKVDQVVCRQWFNERQTFRRELDLKLPADGFYLLRATALICGPGLGIAVAERKVKSDEEGMDVGDRTRNSVTGY